jgi:hypothetical protein
MSFSTPWRDCRQTRVLSCHMSLRHRRTAQPARPRRRCVMKERLALLLPVFTRQSAARRATLGPSRIVLPTSPTGSRAAARGGVGRGAGRFREARAGSAMIAAACVRLLKLTVGARRRCDRHVFIVSGALKQSRIQGAGVLSVLG